ncbi:MAG: serine protease [Verrucomicrobiota bacterium]
MRRLVRIIPHSVRASLNGLFFVVLAVIFAGLFPISGLALSLEDAAGQPVEGKVQGIEGEVVILKTEAGITAKIPLSELSKESRTSVLDWALSSVFSYESAWRLEVIENSGGGLWSSDSVEINFTNLSPMSFPPELEVLYNNYTLIFDFVRVSGNKVGGTDGYFALGEVRPWYTDGEFEGLSSGETFSLNFDFERPTTNKEVTWEDLVEKRPMALPPVPSIRRNLVEVRIVFEGHVLATAWSRPEAKGFAWGKWMNSGDWLPDAGANSDSRESGGPVDTSPFQASISPILEEDTREPDVPLPPIPMGSIAIIDVDDATGTGFISEIKGRQFLVTNAHVIAGASEITCKTAEGQEVLLPNFCFLAKDRDLAIVPIDGREDFLECAEDIFAEVEIGDDVTVFGNEAGAAVVTKLTGRVDGIGPRQVEVDAPFVEGNSGSPIVHHKSGKVIGVAAYYIEYTIPEADREDSEGNYENESDDSEESSTKKRRRFAERIDNAQEWERLTLEELNRERVALEQYSDVVFSVVDIANVIHTDGRVLSPARGHEELRRLLTKFHREFDSSYRVGSAANARALKDLRMALFALMDSRKKMAEDEIRTTYFLEEFERVSLFSDRVKDYLSSVRSR